MTHKITFTLAEIKKHEHCEDVWETLCKSLGGIRKYGKDTPITIEQIIESNGLDDALWALRSTPEETHYLWRHFAVDCAEKVEYLITDHRSLSALEVARRNADGIASDEELASARCSAWGAAYDVARAGDFNSRCATSAVACSCSLYACNAAWSSARDASNATFPDDRTSQKELLIEYCKYGKRPNA